MNIDVAGLFSISSNEPEPSDSVQAVADRLSVSGELLAKTIKGLKLTPHADYVLRKVIGTVSLESVNLGIALRAQ